MKNFIKIVIFSLMVFVLASCGCNKTCEVSPTNEPLVYELQEEVTLFSADTTTAYILLEGSLVYVMEDDNPIVYELLSKDMIDDNEDYREVIIRMGKINDSTEVVGHIKVGKLNSHKRIR
jgi:hypothetical protein